MTEHCSQAFFNGSSSRTSNNYFLNNGKKRLIFIIWMFSEKKKLNYIIGFYKSTILTPNSDLKKLA